MTRKLSRGWIRIPIFSGMVTDATRAKLHHEAEIYAEWIGAAIVKDCGERAERWEDVEPAVWHRFYLFQIEGVPA
jgi:hypothetical protein